MQYLIKHDVAGARVTQTTISLFSTLLHLNSCLHRCASHSAHIRVTVGQALQPWETSHTN